MKIIVAGGGSGGHLTPLLAVGTAIKSLDSQSQVIHIGQKGDKLHDVTNHKSIDVAYQIPAGKFRRYHGETFLQHITDLKTMALNFRDFFRFAFGTFKAWRLLGSIKPDVIFLKGGFVCVPVGYAAKLRKIPYITHDSDAIPGLANRLTAKNAVYNTTAMKPNLYPYEQTKTIQVGIPLQPEFQLVTEKIKNETKKKLGYPSDARLIFSVGGGLGAQNLNKALVNASEDLLEDKNAFIIHLTGKVPYDETKKLYEEILKSPEKLKRVNLLDFSSELYALSAASDVVITRAGATNIAEFATQAKPCIVVPAPHLTGGQQLHNADVLVANKAAIVLQETELPSLAGVVRSLLNDKKLADSYAQSIHQFAISDSADKIAELLLNIAKNKTKNSV